MINRFVDTSGWAAWVSPDDDHHAAAVAAFDEVWDAHGRLVTTTYVLSELTALFVRLRVPRVRQVEVVDEIHADPSVLIVPMEPTPIDAAWALWRSRLDKEWTLVDCGSFVVMDLHKLREAITTDHHFEQAGYIRLLK